MERGSDPAIERERGRGGEGGKRESGGGERERREGGSEGGREEKESGRVGEWGEGGERAI